MSIRNRMQLVCERHGNAEAQAFVDRCVRTYRVAVLTATRGNSYYRLWLDAYREAKAIKLGGYK